jgi:hypothetical protein
MDKKKENTEVLLSRLSLGMDYIRSDVKDIKENLKNTYITKIEFNNLSEKVQENIEYNKEKFDKIENKKVDGSDYAPVKRIVFGVVSILGTALVYAILRVIGL